MDCLVADLTDNTVVNALALVLDKANAAGKPVYGSEIEQVKLGCAAAEGLDYVALGRQTGLMAAKVLKGEAAASDIPYEISSEGGDLCVQLQGRGRSAGRDACRKNWTWPAATEAE